MEGPFSVKEEDSSSSSSGCSGGGGGGGAGCFSGEQEETVCAGVLTVPPVYAYPAEEFKFSPTVAAAQPQINADISLPCSPHKRSGRRSMQKRVISIPVVETEGTRSKGGGDGAPPSDSWTWRKYGQKPIKGSPYPRGYYRCSSSKGCPARKRVERSRADPSMLVITYACEHNHPWPLPKNHNQTHQTLPSNSPVKSEQDSFILSPPDKPDHVFSELSLSMMPDEFNWFSDVSASPPAESFLCSPIAGPPAISPAISPADQESDFEEEEELFAGLGELPECSLVFRRGLFNRPIRVKVEGDDDRLFWHRRMRDNGMEIEREEERGYAAASR